MPITHSHCGSACCESSGTLFGADGVWLGGENVPPNSVRGVEAEVVVGACILGVGAVCVRPPSAGLVV